MRGEERVRFSVATLKKLAVVNIEILQCVVRRGAIEIIVVATGKRGQRAQNIYLLSCSAKPLDY